MKIGEQIKNKRKQERLSAEDLAIKLGLKKENIYKWEKGATPSDPKEYLKVQEWLNNSENGPNNFKEQSQKIIVDANAYIRLLESNDQFFKNEYAQMLLSLNKLIDLGKKSEALIKLNLQHTGIIEAHQQGVSKDEIQAQINNQIAGIGPSEQKDTDEDR